MSKKILVTGSGGFVFSNFVRKVLHDKLPYSFVTIDKVKQSSVLNNIYANKGHTFYIGDVTDRHFIDVIFEYEQPDIVIHGAAETSIDESLKNPDLFIKNNILGTQNIIDACTKWNVDKLIYISTDEVYGQLDSQQEPSWTEESHINPRNPYSVSKASGEMLLNVASNVHGLKFNILRCCNNYGPRQTHDKFVPKIIRSILNNEKMSIYGTGAQIREWMHVFDTCSAIIKILESGKDNESYNISSGVEISNVELFNCICDVINAGHDLLNFVVDRPGHDFRYSMDSSKLIALGWSPKFKFKDGLEHTCTWYKNNQWFFKV